MGRNLMWAVLLWCSIFDWLSHSSCLTLLCGVAMLTLSSCHIPAQRWVKWVLFICNSERTFRCFELATCQCKRHLSLQHNKPQNSSCKLKKFLLPFKCWQTVLMQLQILISSSWIDSKFVWDHSYHISCLSERDYNISNRMDVLICN